MKKIKYIIAAALALFSFEAYSQGCMTGGGSGDIIGVTGFIQPQFNYYINGKDADGKSLNKNEFTFNRARLGVLGSIPYDIDYYFAVEYSGFSNSENKVHLLDGYVSYTRFAKWAKITIGQFKSPISLEQNTACSGLYTVERSEVVKQLAGPQRDLGLLISGGHDSLKFQYALGLMNGSGMNNREDNSNKNIVGRVVVGPFKGLKVGGSFKVGGMNPTDPAERLNNIYRVAAEAQFSWKGLLLQGEYLYGQDKLFSASKVPIYGGCGGIVGFETKQPGTYHKDGAWMIASYRTKYNIEPVLKFDTWNSDKNDRYSRYNTYTIGVNYYINDYTRLQINYANLKESREHMNDMVMVQIQAIF
ncbi:MAG: porin [Bacteroidales bacterium]